MKFKKWIKELTEYAILTIGITTFLFTTLSLMSWSAKKYDERMIQQEYTKKTEMSVTQISQK